MDFPRLTFGSSATSFANAIVDYAAQNRLIKLTYTKYAGDQPYPRLVEPYRFQDSGGNLMVLTWQRDPCPGDTNWRNFRLDRITSIEDGGDTFEPRCKMTICDGEIHEYTKADPVQTSGPMFEYTRAVHSFILDGKLTDEELQAASAFHSLLSPSDIRAAHGRIYLGVLQGVLADNSINADEEDYLKKVRRMLKKLGWAP